MSVWRPRSPRGPGAGHSAWRCHVGHWDECDRLVDTVYDEFGRCDVFVNNAGMSPLYPDLASITEEYYDKVHAVNLKGPFRLGALVGTRMAAGDGGVIINVSTIGSLRPGPNELVYACAKAGLNALTIGLADTFGPRVRVNAILPGPVLTDIADAWTEEERTTVGERLPLKRAGVAARLRRHRPVAGRRGVGVDHRGAGTGRRGGVPPDRLVPRASGRVPSHAVFWARPVSDSGRSAPRWLDETLRAQMKSARNG